MITVTSKKVRILKICELVRQKTRRSRESKVPSLRLSGKWLGELGFVIGSKVVVEMTENGLLIQPAAMFDVSQPKVATNLEELKSLFVSLGISTEKK
jgi:hypothetical protein